ncbi:MAG TPA: cyclic nucleotide-binding domain-containing protein [Usitatibacteraceae bacterium]|nr:cyclic nucleotide-binding domain-containing protein [Usitatibacteraceae bacterium]
MKLEEFLMHQTDIVPLPVGHTLFSEGEYGDSMYVLMSGKADVMIRGKVVETLEVGQIVGELAIVDNAPRAATLVAREDCNLIAINAMKFRELTAENPEFALTVMRAMAHRLRNLGKLL